MLIAARKRQHVMPCLSFQETPRVKDLLGPAFVDLGCAGLRALSLLPTLAASEMWLLGAGVTKVVQDAV